MNFAILLCLMLWTQSGLSANTDDDSNHQYCSGGSHI
eukprot:UN15151